MNNYEKIKSMTIEEMAKHHAVIAVLHMKQINPLIAFDKEEMMKKNIAIYEKWLKKEAEKSTTQQLAQW